MPTIGVPTAAAMCVGSGVARHHHRRAARERDDVRDRRLRRQQPPRRPRRATTAFAELALARPPQHDRHQAVALAQRGGDGGRTASGGQRLFGHAAPGLSSAYRPPVVVHRLSRRRRVDRARSETPARSA